MNMKNLAVAAAVLVTACATSSSSTTAASSTPEASTPTGQSQMTGGGEATASAQLESRSGSSVTGSAKFTQTQAGVKVDVEISGASPGEHGLHLHEKGDCSAPDATSAGAHWNPTSMQHGAPMDMSHHAGDLGNLTVGADGKGTVTITHPEWSIGMAEGKHDITGKAVVFHASPDDLKSQPAGNSGPRQACGVIQATK